MSHSHQPHAHGNGAKHDDSDDDLSLKDKIKHPFHELKEKLEGTHLHNLKVGLTHKKCVCSLSPYLSLSLSLSVSVFPVPCPSSRRSILADTPPSIGTRSGNLQTWCASHSPISTPL